MSKKYKVCELSGRAAIIERKEETLKYEKERNIKFN